MDGLAQPAAAQHQLSRRQQYDTLIEAQAGPSSQPHRDPASPASHPSFPAVATLCKRYPTQSSSILQTYLDLKHAATATWEDVEPLDLSPTSPSEEDPPLPSAPMNDLQNIEHDQAQELLSQRLQEWRQSDMKLGLMYPTASNAQPTSLLQTGLAAIKGRRKEAKTAEIIIPVTITQHLSPEQLDEIFQLIALQASNQSEGETPIETNHILLSVIAQDSTLVYYKLSKGMVKPVN